MEMNKQFKVQEKQMKEVQKVAAEGYAFDQSRIKVAKAIAKEKAIGQGKGRFGQFLAKRRAGKDERISMVAEQELAEKESFKGFMGSIADTIPNTFKSFKPMLGILAPVAGLFKLTKSVFLPFGKDARKFRMRMYKLGQRTMKVLDFFFKYMMLGIVVAGAILIGMRNTFKNYMVF